MNKKYHNEKERKEGLKRAYDKWHRKRWLKTNEENLWTNSIIRELHAQGIGTQSISRRFRLSRGTINGILKGFFK